MQNHIKFDTVDLEQSLQSKLSKLVNILNQPIINIKLLRQECKQGIPDQAPVIREHCWKILLNCLPQQRSKWSKAIQNNEQAYQTFIQTFLPQKKYEGYPLILEKNNPEYPQLLQQFLLWQQIQKDTARTHSELSFFSNPTKPILIPFLTGSRKQKYRLMVGKQSQKYQQFMQNKELQRITYKYHIMTRILFIYSKLNPRIKYVQGMNEVLAPIFYLVNAHKSQDQLQQANCFFMLNNVMSVIIDMHIKDLDNSQSGISGKLNQINNMLLIIQPQIWKYLEKLQIQPVFYLLRWVTLLFSQEFFLFDIMRLWDSIFSYEDKIQYMNFVALALIILNKNTILKSEFSEILQKLQNLKFSTEIRQVISLAVSLLDKFYGMNFELQAKKKKQQIYTSSKNSKSPSKKKINKK